MELSEGGGKRVRDKSTRDLRNTPTHAFLWKMTTYTKDALHKWLKQKGLSVEEAVARQGPEGVRLPPEAILQEFEKYFKESPQEGFAAEGVLRKIDWASVRNTVRECTETHLSTEDLTADWRQIYTDGSSPMRPRDCATEAGSRATLNPGSGSPPHW